MEFTKNLVKRHKIVPYLEQYLSTEIQHFQFEYRPKPQDDAFHPSGHAVAVPSKLWAMIKQNLMHADAGEEFSTQSHSGTMLKAFMVGHFWHALLQKAVVDLELAGEDDIERRGFKVWEWDHMKHLEPEHPLWVPLGMDARPPEHFQPHSRPKPYHWATGSGDVVPCKIPGTDDTCVLDFKTMAGVQFKANSLPAWAASKYEAQVNVYMDWFDQDRAILVCINKDAPHGMKEFEFERNQPLIDQIYEQWEFVSAAVDADECPTPEDDAMFDFEDLYTGPIEQT